VKYVDYTNVDTGTYEISSIDYETLIVKNGNVFIKNDLNTN
jgi:hypothetical protein